MKARVQNCEACRKQIHKEEQEAYLKKQFAWLNDGLYTMGTMSAAVALVALMQQGRSKAYVQRFFERMVMIYDTGEVMGKPIVLTDVMKQLEAEYDIDFSRIHVNFNETEREFIKNCKKGARVHE